MTGAVRWTLAPFPAGEDPDEKLFSALAGIEVSWTGEASRVTLWADRRTAPEVRQAFSAAGLRVVAEEEEAERDWLAESAALRKAVATGRYLLDPHDGERATPAGGRCRLYLPAARAFGTGSHESTRIAVRLLLQELLAGRTVLDVGCGAGTLAFVAASEGAARVVACDIDPDAAVATRENGIANRLRGVLPLAGPVESLRPGERFDLAVANMLQEELQPVLGPLRHLLKPGGTLLTSGQLRSREEEWLASLAAEGFSGFRLTSENEWLGVAASRT